MQGKNHVLVIGLDPTLVDFSEMPGMNAEKVRSGLENDQTTLNGMGYETDLCLTDLGKTAEAVVRKYLSEKDYTCIVIGAGIRTLPEHFLLFERLIKVVHQHAPQAKICLNTKPRDTAEAVERWI